MKSNNLETGAADSSEVQKPSAVLQPGKAPELQELLGSMESGEISEYVGDSAGEQGGGGGQQVQAGGGQQGDDGAMSARDIAIQNLPTTKIMQTQITKHIKKEIRSLRKQTKKITRMGRPGSAHELTELYARMRRLNALLHEVWDASFEVVKRLFIRLFIDKQTLL